MSQELISEIALAMRTSRIVSDALALNLDHVRGTIAALDSLPKIDGPVTRLSAERARHLRLIVFFAEQLREGLIEPPELDRLLSQAKTTLPAFPL